MSQRLMYTCAGLAVMLSAGAYFAQAQNPPVPPVPPPPVQQPPVTPPPIQQPPVTRPPVQQPPVTRPPVQQPPVVLQPNIGQMPRAHHVKAVLGSKVSIQGSLAIGTVDDIIFDDNGYIDYLIVVNEGKYVTVPWEAMKYNFDQRVVTVNITQAQYRQIPTYTSQQIPTFYDTAYRTRIYQYYGLTPGQERRMDRRGIRGGGGG